MKDIAKLRAGELVIYGASENRIDFTEDIDAFAAYLHNAGMAEIKSDGIYLASSGAHHCKQIVRQVIANGLADEVTQIIDELSLNLVAIMNA